MENEKKPNLYQKIQAVSNEIRNIEKGLTVGSGSYSYKAVGDLDVTLAVKDAETKHGIISIPIKQQLVNSEIVRTIKKDNIEGLTYVDTIKMTVRIIDVDFPSDFIEIESFGKGIDSGDKGLGKASTYARKYALLNAYKIATGEDPDSEKSKETTVLTEDLMLDAIKEVCLKDNEKQTNILLHFAVNSLDQLSKEQKKIVYGQFKSKKLL